MKPHGNESGMQEAIVEYHFRYTEDHLIETYRRCVRACPERLWFRLLKLVAGIGLCVLLWIFLQILGKHPSALIMVLLFATLIGVLLAGPRINYIWYRRRFRKSVAYEVELKVALCKSSFRSVGKLWQNQYDWSYFKRWKQFDDGLLLIAESFVYWLPDTALVKGARNSAETLLREVVKNDSDK